MFTANSSARGAIFAQGVADVSLTRQQQGVQAVLDYLGGSGSFKTTSSLTAPVTATDRDLWLAGDVLKRWNGRYGVTPITNTITSPDPLLSSVNWSTVGTTMTIDPLTTLFPGVSSMRGTVDGTTNQPCLSVNNQPCVAGQVLTISGYARSTRLSGIKTFIPQVNFFNGITPVLTFLGTVSASDASDQWVRFFVTATVPVAATNFTLTITPASPDDVQAGDTFFLLAPLCVVGTTLTAFICGSMLGVSWTGTAGASSSLYSPGWEAMSTPNAMVVNGVFGSLSVPMTMYAGDEPLAAFMNDRWIDHSGVLYVYTSGWTVVVDTGGPAALDVANQAIYDANHITSTQILDGSITTPKLAAGGIVAGDILSGALRATTEIIAGDPEADYFSLTSTGARAFVDSPDITQPSLEVVSLGTGGANAFAVLDPVTSETLAAITKNGTVQGSSGVFDSLTVGGVDIFDLINALPRGMIGYGEQGLDTGPYYSEAGYFEFGCTIGAGRMVKVSMRMTVQMETTGATGFGYKIRGTYTSDGSTPSAPVVTSPIYLTGAVVPRVAGGNFGMADFILVRNLTGSDVNVRLLTTGVTNSSDYGFYFVPDGAGTSYWGDPNPTAGNIIVVEDLGPDQGSGSAYSLGGGGQKPADPPPPPPPATPPPQKYVKTTAMSWSAVMDQNGLSNSWDGGTYLIAGTAGGYHYACYLGFADIIPTGATINKLEVYLKNAGGGYPGTQGLSNHQLSAKPTGSPPSGYGGYSVSFANGEAKWITIPSSTYSSWASNTYKGVAIGSAGATWPWQRFYRSGTYKPVLRATYTI